MTDKEREALAVKMAKSMQVEMAPQVDTMLISLASELLKTAEAIQLTTLVAVAKWFAKQGPSMEAIGLHMLQAWKDGKIEAPDFFEG